ncbi:MAG TPA: ribonuclease Z [Candidatus Thermoplasmatota archaeon]|nr:ribonuclease Z [Candidatus Thermoplasmatota archaeon]
MPGTRFPTTLMHENMEIVFLGTGASWPSVERNVAAVAVKRGSEILLFDCGEGTQRQFQKSRLSYMQVSNLFLTHMHADHFLGIPGMVQTMRLNERHEPLTIHGPPGTKDVIGPLLEIGRSRGAFKVNLREVKSGEALEFDGYSVHARELKHTAYNLGYAIVEHDRPGRFNKPRAIELGVPEGKLFGKLQRGDAIETPEGVRVTPDMVLGPSRRGRKIAYTGDCVPCEGTVELARGADVLIHESTYGSDFADANAYGHSTAAQAAFMARAAAVGRLYLTHISPRYTDARPLVEEARKLFPETHEARDFTEFVVKFPADPDAPKDEAPTPAL